MNRLGQLRRWDAYDSLWAVAAFLVCASAVAWCMRAPGTPAEGLSTTRAERVAHQLAAQEPRLRKKAIRMFPGDRWSQDDAYYNEEHGLVRAVARREDVAIGSVLGALDAYLRTHPDSARKTTLAPCKPRPFYD